MGLYDTINGHQVKCFNWVSFYKDEICYHGGNCRYFDIGFSVPYRESHYNYTKDFMILDLDRVSRLDKDETRYIIHIIRDGVVTETFENTLDGVDFTGLNKVISYMGDDYNIHSTQDILDYIKEDRIFLDRWNTITEVRDDLFKDYSRYMTGLGRLPKDSPERVEREGVLESLRIKIEEEGKRIESIVEELQTEHHNRWFIDPTSDTIQMLGDLISAYGLQNEESSICRDKIKTLLNDNPRLFQEYIDWIGTDEYIREFIDE